MGFVLSRSRRSPSVEDILIGLHQQGLPAEADAHRGGSEYGFEFSDGGSLVASFVNAQHPDLTAITFTSGWLGTELEATVSHLMVILYQPAETEPGAPDRLLMRSIAAVADATDAVGARVGLGLNYFTIDDFRASLEGLDAHASVPSRLVIGCDIAVPNDDQVSILSSGLVSYGREDLLILAPQAKKDEAVELLWNLADHLRAQGDDVDSLTVIAESATGVSHPPKRVPNPTSQDQEVIEIVLAI